MSCRAPAAALLVAIALAGCGYRLSGTWAQLPSGIRTVSVPPVVNTTVRQELDVPVTEAFRARMEALGYPSVSSGQPESTLVVHLLSCTDTPISWDTTQQVREYRLTVTARIELVTAGATEPVRRADGVAASEPYPAGATQEETNDNRTEALDVVATRLASDGIERLLTGF